MYSIIFLDIESINEAAYSFKFSLNLSILSMIKTIPRQGYAILRELLFEAHAFTF